MNSDSSGNSRLEEIRSIRLEKLAKLRQLGIDPYPPKYSGGLLTPIATARTQSDVTLSVSGRLMTLREHGNIIFADLKDDSGKIQLFFQKQKLADKFSLLKLIDSGDFLGVTGQIFTTQAGEISVNVDSFELLSKSLRPLPDEWHGLKDEEARYRQRYVDLLLNDDLRDLFKKKSIFWNSMRDFLSRKGFLEVETPVLENTAGGADANPFVTHHNALDIDLYLRISMGELWQKRLMVAGFGKTFEIGRQFRNEGISREHLQDYTQMEFYWGYADYSDSMKLVEEMYRHVVNSTFGTLQFTLDGQTFDLSKPWEVIDYTEIITQKYQLDISTISVSALQAKLTELGVKFSSSDDKGRLIDHLWKTIRKSIAGPAFLTGHPVEVSPLAKRDPAHSGFVQRYQVILGGSEMGNGYSELNDPVDQAQRFQVQQNLRDKGDAEAQMNDDDFVRALEYGMPPVTGFGVSERLFSFLAGKPIRETVLFPLLRPENPGVVQSATIVTSSIKTDKYEISPAVKHKFPGISFAYTIIRGVNISKENPELERLKKEVIESKKKLTFEQIQEIQPIQVYRNMFKETGVDYHSRRPSPEALLRRLSQGKDLYHINTAVDAYNLAVIETGFGLGGFDLSQISAPVMLRFSLAGEKMHLLGDETDTVVEAGELVYADQDKLLTLDLNYRDINSTKITEKTKDIILFADGGPDLDPEEVKSALISGASYIAQFNGGEIGEIFIIN